MRINNKKLKNRKKLLLDFVSNKEYQPMRAKDIAMLLQIPKGKRSELFQVLDELEAEGKIICKKGRYEKVRKIATVKTGSPELSEGTFIAHPKGFGFVELEDQEEDLYIPQDDTMGAFHKDRVQVKVKEERTGQRREGTIVQILGHGITEVVGTFEKSKNYGFVIPDNQKIQQDIFIPREHTLGANDGDKVVAKITSYGGKNKNPEGRVQEVLGAQGAPGIDVLSIARAYELPMDFPVKVANQADRVPDHVIEGDFQGRMDLRNWTVVTIDGEDAKDLDDGISLTKDGNIYHLGVHIADVSNYVQGGSALDREALRRGTSVYLVDRVIPMLPHTLSNGICSLNQGEDRLALSCIMKVDAKGNIVDHRITESVINVDRRMSYTDVNKIITLKDEEKTKEYEDFVPMFFAMKELADILRAKRRKRGSIDFDFPETKVILDREGHPVEIKPYDRNAATKIIEDFMLAANETVAQDYFWQELPFVYRTHETPDTDKIRKLSTFINNFGYHIHIGSDEVHPKELQKLLEKIEDTPVEGLISRLTLRSMKQARYSVECLGHFGLAAQYYCHFTSPIRRYPDLQIHRIIKDNLRGRMNQKRIDHYWEILPEVAKQSSQMERRADEAERETIKLKKVEYMEKRIGQIYEGVISGITNYGLYVELPNTIEGMVHVTALEGDYFNYVESTYEMVGEHTGKSYKLGQTVQVRVAGTDRLLRTIDFEIVSEL